MRWRAPSRTCHRTGVRVDSPRRTQDTSRAKGTFRRFELSGAETSPPDAASVQRPGGLNLPPSGSGKLPRLDVTFDVLVVVLCTHRVREALGGEVGVGALTNEVMPLDVVLVGIGTHRVANGVPEIVAAGFVAVEDPDVALDVLVVTDRADRVADGV